MTAKDAIFPTIIFNVKTKYTTIYGKKKVVRAQAIQKPGRIPRRSFYPFKAVITQPLREPWKRYLRLVNRWASILIEPPHQYLLKAIQEEGKRFWRARINLYFRRRTTYGTREGLRKGKMGYSVPSEGKKKIRLRRTYQLRDKLTVKMITETVSKSKRKKKVGSVYFTSEAENKGFRYAEVLKKGRKGKIGYVYVPEIDRMVRVKRSRKRHGAYKPTQWKRFEKVFREHLNKWAMDNIYWIWNKARSETKT